MTERFVSIFDKKPSQLPSKRYDPWITAFEKIVTEAQKKISAISKQERLYNIIKDFLELQNLPNATKINVNETYIGIHIKAQPTNKKADIDDFYNRLTYTLCNYGLVDKGYEPVIQWAGSYHYDVDARYWLKESRLVAVSWDIPSDGIADLEVETIRKEVLTYNTSYRLIPRVAPQAITKD